jgi:hypothetical protein
VGGFVLIGMIVISEWFCVLGRGKHWITDNKKSWVYRRGICGCTRVFLVVRHKSLTSMTREVYHHVLGLHIFFPLEHFSRVSVLSVVFSATARTRPPASF